MSPFLFTSAELNTRSFKTYLDFVKGDPKLFIRLSFRTLPINQTDPVLERLLLSFTANVSKKIIVKHLEQDPYRTHYYVRYIIDLRFNIVIVFKSYMVYVEVIDNPSNYSGYEIKCPEITERLLYLIEDQKRRDTNVFNKVMSVVDDIEKQEKTPETYEDCCLCLDNTNPISFRCNTCKEGLICKSCVKPFKKRFHTCPCCRADRHKKTG